MGEYVERQFTFFEVRENAQGNADGRVQMSPGNPSGKVDRHADADAPDNADFPQAKTGTRDLERGNATCTKKDQQRRTQKLGHALARERRLL
ncbi:hypothetical protein D3C81_1798090 [compost metagenome]